MGSDFIGEQAAERFNYKKNNYLFTICANNGHDFNQGLSHRVAAARHSAISRSE
ncbi:hypothetical protein JHW44_00430 [Paracoccus seriniphilus]|nr:hypothetical protein JHW44_00430 [Paracoccus seriniphilus]